MFVFFYCNHDNDLLLWNQNKRSTFGRTEAVHMAVDYKKLIIELLEKTNDNEKLKLLYRIIKRYLAD